MLSARLARTAVNSVMRKQAFSAQKVVYTNYKHKDMGGGGHFGADPHHDDPLYNEANYSNGHGHDHHDHGHHDHHAHPVFDLPFSRGQAFTFTWLIYFLGIGAVLLSCQFQQRKQGFTTVKDRFSE